MKRSNKLNLDQNVTVIAKEREIMIEGETIETIASIDTVKEMVMMLAVETTMRTVTGTDLARKNAGASETTRKTVKIIPEAKGPRSNRKFRGNSRQSQMTISSKSVTMPCQVSFPGTFKTSTTSITGSKT